MKKYRLKEEVKKYFEKWHTDEACLRSWEKFGVTLEALEEVPSRIEIDTLTISTNSNIAPIYRKSTDQEKDLCEKALNGELLDIDSLDDNDFRRWYNRSDNVADISYVKDDKISGIKAVLKQYLKKRNKRSLVWKKKKKKHFLNLH